MFVITDSAIEQFKNSAKAIADPYLALRISAQRLEHGEMKYNMGFDNKKPDDLSFQISDLQVIVDKASAPNVTAMVLDYRNFQGVDQFVFLNPNDLQPDAGENSCSGCKDNTSCNHSD